MTAGAGCSGVASAPPAALSNRPSHVTADSEGGVAPLIQCDAQISVSANAGK